MKNSSLIIATILIFLFLSTEVNAQLFVTKNFYHGITTVKSKYKRGSNWVVAQIDNLGRTAKIESFNKSNLLAEHYYIYNSNNDILYYIVNSYINNENRINDTLCCYEYKYQGNRIVYQKETHPPYCDSTVIQLIENKDDTILIYHQKSYYFRTKTNTTDIFETKYTLKYKDGLLIFFETFDINNNSKETEYFEYFSNRMLRHREIEKQPGAKFKGLKGHYSGRDPHSDDMFYEYKFDRKGRIKTLYYIIEKKRYKITTYQYCEK